MGYNVATTGPEIINRSESGVNTPSGQYEWYRTRFSNSVSRTKPKGFDLLKGVSFNTYDSFRSIGLQTTSKGSRYASPVNAAPENFDNESYQSSRKGVVSKLRSKVKGESWNVSTFVGELPETWSYFKQTLTTIVRTYRAVKRGNMKEVRRMRKRRPSTRPPKVGPGLDEQVAGKWLEWRYAITPLMLDFQAMLNALQESSARAVYTRVATGEDLRFFQRQVTGYLGTVPQYSTRVHTMKLRLGLYYRVNPSVQAFKRLGLLNPVATLWELTPLSFVVDWFIPIGDYLGSLDAMAGVSVWASWESQAVMTDFHVTGATFTSGVPGTSGYVVATRTESNASKRYYNRNNAPSLSMPLPTFQLGLNSKRFLDGLSLVRGALPRGSTSSSYGR